MTLFINSCVREESRTLRLARCLLSQLNGIYEEVKLNEIDFPVTDQAFLNRRDNMIAAGEYNDSMFNLAKQFARADEIVIAAPYWDLSFPASLKQYIEQVNVLGITFSYTPEGTPVGLCKANRLTYVMTAGGTFVPQEYGFGYVKTLAQSFYGIPEVRLIKATGLDIDGADVQSIMKEAEEKI